MGRCPFRFQGLGESEDLSRWLNIAGAAGDDVIERLIRAYYTREPLLWVCYHVRSLRSGAITVFVLSFFFLTYSLVAFSSLWLPILSPTSCRFAAVSLLYPLPPSPGWPSPRDNNPRLPRA